MAFDSLLSPLGWITIFEYEKNIVALELGNVKDPQKTPLLAETKKQLNLETQTLTDHGSLYWNQLKAI